MYRPLSQTDIHTGLILNLPIILNGLYLLQIWEVHFHSQGYQDENVMLSGQRCIAWPDCREANADLALILVEKPFYK